jgi:hypothetical protein
VNAISESDIIQLIGAALNGKVCQLPSVTDPQGNTFAVTAQPMYAVKDPRTPGLGATTVQNFGYYIRIASEMDRKYNESMAPGQHPQTRGLIGAKYTITITAFRRRTGDPFTEQALVWAMIDEVRRFVMDYVITQGLIGTSFFSFEWKGNAEPTAPIENIEQVAARFEAVAQLYQNHIT